MREIKLKVVTISNVDNCLIEISEPMSVKKVGDYIAERIDKDCVERYEYIQFTGLKDKNGKEIYEGDILSSLYVDDGCKGLYEVVFENGNFKPRRRKEHQQQYVEVVMSDLERCAIIGNIYDNPELLTNN